MSSWLNNYTGRETTQTLTKAEQRKMEMQVQEYFKMVTAYSPVYNSFSGGVYEMELTRACIHSLATHCSKANPKILGNIYRQFEKQLQTKPNSLMTTSQFLYKVATIYFAENNCFIVPLYENRDRSRIIGLYPVRASDTKVVNVDGTVMLNYKVKMGNEYPREYSIPYEEVGHLKSHYYKQDIYGENNDVLYPTMQMMNAQKNSILGSVENSAIIRFIARTKIPMQGADVEREQKLRNSIALNASNSNGIMIFDNSVDEIKQVTSTPVFVEPEQNMQIKANAFSHFGVNEDFIQNKGTEDLMNSVFEGAIEPFLIQCGQVLTTVLFNQSEIAKGSEVVLEDSAWSRASNKTKLSLQNMVDRGAMSPNEWRKILNLPAVKGGDTMYIRGEYIPTDQLKQIPIGDKVKPVEEVEDEETEGEEDDNQG